jgi:hypothetical protein
VSWVEEIIELHDFFEGWFRGREDSLERLSSVLAPEFSIVSPAGDVQRRDAFLAVMAAAKGRRPDLRIQTADHELLHSGDEFAIASYIERQRGPDATNSRLSTVVFLRDPEAVNGVIWLRVHETSLSGG